MDMFWDNYNKFNENEEEENNISDKEEKPNLDWSNLGLWYAEQMLKNSREKRNQQNIEKEEDKEKEEEQEEEKVKSKIVLPSCPGSIEFARTTYEEKGEYNEFEMLEDIRELIRILLKNDYQIKIHDDGYTTAVEFEFADPDLRMYNLSWVEEE